MEDGWRMNIKGLGKNFILMSLCVGFTVFADEYSIEIDLVKQQLIDPDSAKIQKLTNVVNSKGKESVCGEVNSRNRMGGYAGFRNFAVIEHKIVAFQNEDISGKLYNLSGCAGSEMEMVTRLSDEAKFSCSVLWTMVTNTLVEGETPSEAIDSALRATVNHASENGVTLMDVQQQTIKKEFENTLNSTLTNKLQADAIKKSPGYQGDIFQRACTAQTLILLKSHMGIK